MLFSVIGSILQEMTRCGVGLVYTSCGSPNVFHLKNNVIQQGIRLAWRNGPEFYALTHHYNYYIHYK